MKLASLPQREWQPAIRRLDALSPLGPEAVEAIEQAAAASRSYEPRRELVIEGRAVAGPVLILEGWAARTRELADGRRQIISFVLPGDFVGMCAQRDPLASSTVLTITPLSACAVPDHAALPDLAEAIAISRAIDEALLLGQVTRLGRLTAHERIVDILLEFLERLELAGLASADSYRLPITQEMLADALGLTPVHINRTLQLARKARELDWREKTIVLNDVAALRRQVGRVPVRVSASQRG